MKKALIVVGGLAVMFIGLLGFSGRALADGGIMPRPDYFAYETGQKAVIVYENGVETLIVSTDFQGNSKDFGWIIPTPAKPEVDKGQDQLFAALKTLTQQRMVYGKGGIGVAPMASAPTESAVTVLETKQVDVYDIAVLSATDKSALYDWLAQNGYQYPAAKKDILDSYIADGWIFTAVKVRNDLADAQDATQALNEGHATPLKLVFPTNKIVYPMRVSSIREEPKKVTAADAERIVKDVLSDKKVYKDSKAAAFAGIGLTKQRYDAFPTFPVDDNYLKNYILDEWGESASAGGNSVGVTLYIFADHKKQMPGFDIFWSDWRNQKQISNLASTDKGEPWYQPKSKKLYLTAMSRDFTLAEMKEDLYATDADNNDKTGGSSGTTSPTSTTAVIVTTAVFLGICIFFILLALAHRAVHQTVWKIIIVVTQVLLALAEAVAGLVTAGVYASSFGDLGLYLWLAPFFFGVAVFIAMVTTIIVQIYRDSRRRAG